MLVWVMLEVIFLWGSVGFFYGFLVVVCWLSFGFVLGWRIEDCYGVIIYILFGIGLKVIFENVCWGI